MREHEQVYPCHICAERRYSRRVNLVQHLTNVHDFSDDAAYNQACMCKRSEPKKAYACGFCVRIFGTHRDLLIHIDDEHWKCGQDLSDWDLNKVIQGLLLQPDIQSSWLNRLVDTSSADPKLTWNPSNAEELIRRLGLSEEPADDLAVAAIAQLTPVHQFPISGNFWEPMDNITRHRVEPFQRLDHIASNSLFDAESMESGLDSMASSRTPVVSDRFSLLAADELVTCLLQNAELSVVYKTALESPHVGPDRFERKVRRILNQYSRDLKKEVWNRAQKSAAILVRRRSRYIANMVRRNLERPRRL